MSAKEPDLNVSFFVRCGVVLCSALADAQSDILCCRTSFHACQEGVEVVLKYLTGTLELPVLPCFAMMFPPVAQTHHRQTNDHEHDVDQLDTIRKQACD